MPTSRNLYMQLAKPCPCGSEPQMIRAGIWFFVCCPDCDKKGPVDLEQAEAVRLWNEQIEQEHKGV
jgi:hypothetical protein